MLNPITAKRIEIVCGSVEAFLVDPSKFHDKFQDPNYKWMCSVRIEDARASKERLLAWAKTDKRPSGGSLGEWIFNRNLPKTNREEVPGFAISLTVNAIQKNWKTPTEFPCCPHDTSNRSITDYAANLKVDTVFSKNQYASSIVESFAVSKDENTLWIMCRSSDISAIKPFSLAEITIENDKYVHKNLGSFFQKVGAEKEFKLAQGIEWTGGITFDDLC